MRRDGQAATLRAQKARLNPKAQLEARDSTAKVTLDHALLNELAARSSKLADQAPLGPSKSGARDTVSDAAPPWWPDLPGPRMTGLMVSTVG
jgi:hypothetical protein